MNTKIKKIGRHLAAFALLLVLLAACVPIPLDPAAADQPTPTAGESSTPLPTQTPEQPSPRPGNPAGLATVEPSQPAEMAEIPAKVMDLLQADLVERLGSLPANLVVVSSEAIVWSDGSLGCPEPGVSYTQAMVDGYRVVLQSGETTYDYHIGSLSSKPVLCEPRIK
jgi:hypothetical protein